MEAETRARAEAWQEITRRMAEILFVYTLREYMGLHPNAPGALMALSDHRMAQALRAVHADPAANWSIEALAARASLSKTTFTEAFRKMLGVTPMQYVTSWRLHKARALLDRADRSIQQIALEVGYESESSFNRAFKEQFGAPPGRFRRALSDANV